MRVALIGLDFGDPDFSESFEELRLLAASAGAQTLIEFKGKRPKPDAALFVGSGKAEEIAAAVAEYDLAGVIFNHALSPAQQRNLERVVKARVIDRTTLILDIFALRAASHEGKLQVELAQLRHLSSRLVRQWSHLERQRGGIGIRGPGEKQLELDRRMLDARVKHLQADLQRLSRQRDTQRRARNRSGMFTVSLVGYTNAGKSTLFNMLTHAGVYAADQLFATLDTTTRRVFLGDEDGGGLNFALSDTVGFIRELPHHLVEAFKATLEETVHADLLLHVVDGASPSRMAQIAQVEAVLTEIGAQDVPRINVINKIDLSGAPPGLVQDEDGVAREVRLSARTGDGMELLRDLIKMRAASKQTNRLAAVADLSVAPIEKVERVAIG
jgi:GTP-binding protein HflX